MKKGFLGVLLAGVLGACSVTGCQKAPEASADSDVYHAKGSLEGEVENIRTEEGDANRDPADETESGISCDAMVGTEQNGIWICADIPAVPQTVPTLTLQPRDDWDEKKLEELLDGRNKNVRDITAEYLARSEKELNEMDEEDRPGEWMNFGDDSFMILSDGEKEVHFARNTCAGYVDEPLKADCDAIYKKAPETDVTGTGDTAFAKFSVSRAEEILLEKLAVLDITELHISEAFYYELGETAFYELLFTPSYGKMGVASEFGGIRYGEARPNGRAWITEHGVATLALEDYCGKITERSEDGAILTFTQVTGILEKYLESNALCGTPTAKLTRAELVYYPAFCESAMVLTPAWHIYIPLKDMMESLESGDQAWQQAVENGGAWNIYLNAVTGELIKVE